MRGVLLVEVVRAPDDELDAVALLTHAVRDAPRPAVVLALGPLTNLAEALDASPDLTGEIGGVVVMGGAVDVPGNVQLDPGADPLAAEWNFYVDPAAAAMVLGSGAPVTLVGLDASNEVPVPGDLVHRLAANEGTTEARYARRLVERYPPPYLWDPLAAIAATVPALVPTQARAIAVVVEGADA